MAIETEPATTGADERGAAPSPIPSPAPATPAAPAAPAAARVYRRNLVLFVVLVALVGIWFQRHLQIWVSETRLVAGTLSVWGAWKLVQSWLTWGWDPKAVTERWLGRSSATEVLSLGIAFALVLLGTTASVYLVYEGAPPGESSYQVAVLHDGNPYLPTMTLRSFERVAGRPFLLHLSPAALVFEIQEPSGYTPLTRRLGPGSHVYLRVPADFAKKTLHAVCLAPGQGVFAPLPRPEDSPQVRYSLRVFRGAEAYAVDDLRRRTVCAGAGEKDLEWLWGRSDKEEAHRKFDRYLESLGVPPGAREDKIQAWQAPPLLLSTAEFAGKDALRVEIWKDQEKLLEQALLVSDRPGIQIEFLEVKTP